MENRFDQSARGPTGGAAWREGVRRLGRRLFCHGEAQPFDFDALTREAAAGLPRREVLRRLGLGLGGALLGAVGVAPAWAAKPSSGGGGCPSGQFACPPGSRVHCCPNGYTCCGGYCAYTGSDPNNCGGCGHVCKNSYSCSNGVCCPSGYTGCGTSSCCASTQACVNGACCTTNSNTCSPYSECCSQNCSSYSGTGICCPTGQTNCSGNCVNTNTDNNNCGGCGSSYACLQGYTCSNGACCPTGSTNCGGGSCYNLLADPSNCGACGRTCSNGQTCVNGACFFQCSGDACSSPTVSSDVCMYPPCLCFATTDSGELYLISSSLCGGVAQPEPNSCSKSTDCPQGSACVVGGNDCGSETYFCLPSCG
jgi:stigma-specific protein Stig1